MLDYRNRLWEKMRRSGSANRCRGAIFKEYIIPPESGNCGPLRPTSRRTSRWRNRYKRPPAPLRLSAQLFNQSHDRTIGCQNNCVRYLELRNRYGHAGGRNYLPEAMPQTAIAHDFIEMPTLAMAFLGDETEGPLNIGWELQCLSR